MISARHIETEVMSADGSGIHIHPPEVAATVMVRRAPGLRAEIVVLGPRTRARYDRTDSRSSQCAVARIHPGSLRPLLDRMRAADLVDRAVPLTRIWGTPAADLAEEWSDPELTMSAVTHRLHNALVERLGAHPGTDRHRDLLDNAQRALAAEGDHTDVAELARNLGISERHLRTLFTDEIGLSPKHFARLLRVRRVAELARDSDLAELAPRAGYYDQAHMTTDFRRIMGVPPGAYAAGRYPTPRGCGGRVAAG